MAKRKSTKEQTTQWPKEKGQKNRQHNGQKKKDKRTDNTMAKRKRTDNTMAKTKVQKDKQRSTEHTHNIKHRVTRSPLKTEGELRCYGRVDSSCSTSDTRRVNLVTTPVINHEWGKDRTVLTTSGPYPWSFMTQIFHNGQPSRSGDCKTFEVITST